VGGRRGRLQLLVGAAVLTLIFYFVLQALGPWGPLADAWILTGSILATYGMARGWVEFWLIWIAVDLVGVPLLLVGRLTTRPRSCTSSMAPSALSGL
jgi:nicotinamide mononucleotide transporter